MRLKHLWRSRFKFDLCACIIIAFAIFPSGFLRFVQCQFDQLPPPQLLAPPSFQSPTGLAYSSLDNLTSAILSSKLVQDYSFCIQNPYTLFPISPFFAEILWVLEKLHNFIFWRNFVDFDWLFILFSFWREGEWNRAFNYSSDLSFLTACIAKTGGSFFFSFPKKRVIYSFDSIKVEFFHLTIKISDVVSYEFIMVLIPTFLASWLSLNYTVFNVRSRVVNNQILWYSTRFVSFATLCKSIFGNRENWT